MRSKVSRVFLNLCLILLRMSNCIRLMVYVIGAALWVTPCWENAERMKFGTHLGMPQLLSCSDITFRLCETAGGLQRALAAVLQISN